MPVYIARLRDGSCLIGEAENEESVRKLFTEGDEVCNVDAAEIVTILALQPNTFISRRWMNEQPYELKSEIGRLEGSINHDLEWDIFTHELPMLASAHTSTEREEPLVPKDLPERPRQFSIRV